jgi:hypothetical protein
VKNYHYKNRTKNEIEELQNHLQVMEGLAVALEKRIQDRILFNGLLLLKKKKFYLFNGLLY